MQKHECYAKGLINITLDYLDDPECPHRLHQKRETEGGQTHRGKGYMKVESWIRERLPLVKGCLEEARKIISHPHNLCRECGSTDILILDFWPPGT